jgi:hypothetical protein
VSEFPVISFVGKKVVYQNNKPGKILGDLSIRGVTKEHSFFIEWKGEYPDPVDKNKRSLFLTANTTINRKDYGIRWNKALDKGGWVVGDRVDVEIIIEANPTDARPAFSRFYRKTKKILPGKLKAPSNSSLTPKVKFKKNGGEGQGEKKSPKVPQVTNKKLALGGLSLIFGFILFIVLIVASYFLKKNLQDFLEKKMSSFWSELISDSLLFTFLFGAAYFLAPLMGYKRFF